MDAVTSLTMYRVLAVGMVISTRFAHTGTVERYLVSRKKDCRVSRRE
jgi:hypothetical protein